MKKTFLAKRNSLLSSAEALWGIVALACAIVILLIRLAFPNFFWHVFTPIFRSADALSTKTHSFLSSFNNAAALTSKNEQLTNENATLAIENQTLSKKLEDISALSKSQTPPTGILAGVVARPPESPYDTLVLSSGSQNGVALGQEAFGIGGVPVGVVSSVLHDFSRIMLFSAPNTDTSGWIGKNNLPITIFGSGGGTMKASVSRSANISAGDTVFVPGPGMLPIGSVVRVDSDPSSPSVTLRIQFATNPFSISWVTLRDVGSTLLTATSTFL